MINLNVEDIRTMAIQDTSGTLVMDTNKNFKDTLAKVVTAGMLISAQEMNNKDGNILLRGNTATSLDGPIIPEEAGAKFYGTTDATNKTTLS
jgi:hypothetical protein